MVAALGLAIAAGPAMAGSASVSFSGQVPARGRNALTVVSASSVSFSDESGLQFISRNAGAAPVRRVFSVVSADGKPLAAEVWPVEAVLQPGAFRKVTVFVPFGDAPSHSYRVCVQSFSLSGPAVGTVCQAHAARRVN